MAIPSLKYYKESENILSPEFGTTGSACFDIYSHFDDGHISLWLDDKEAKQARQTKRDPQGNIYVLIYPQERMLIPTGLTFDIPKDHSVRIHIRSSVALRDGLLLGNGEGVVDSDYVDPCYLILYNANNTARQIYNDTRYAQGELIKNYKYSFTEVKEAPGQKTERDGGFGSTDVKSELSKGPSTGTSGLAI